MENQTMAAKNPEFEILIKNLTIAIEYHQNEISIDKPHLKEIYERQWNIKKIKIIMIILF
jgi:hypothetical protein